MAIKRDKTVITQRFGW